MRGGEFVALIGASGCGKTTLLNVIAGLVPAAAGTVTVAGAPPAAGRRDICYVLARDALLPWRTVMGNVEYGLELSGVGREERARRAATYVEKVGLSAARDLYPSKLSQGMRQRVSLARAFAVGRGLYLMDEPFSALDLQTKLRPARSAARPVGDQRRHRRVRDARHRRGDHARRPGARDVEAGQRASSRRSASTLRGRARPRRCRRTRTITISTAGPGRP